MYQSSKASAREHDGSAPHGLLWVAIGFFWAPVSFPALLCVFVLEWRSWHLSLIRQSVTGGFAKSLVLLAFLAVYFGIRGLHDTAGAEVVIMVYRTMSLWLLYLFAFAHGREISDGYRVIAFYCIGMLIKSAWVVGTTLAIDPVVVAGRGLLDPFTGEIVNSPGYSNMAALAALAAIGGLVGKNLMVGWRSGNRLLLGVVCVVALGIAIVLQARTFFLLVAVAIGMVLWRFRKAAFLSFVLAVSVVTSLILLFGDNLVQELGIGGSEAALVRGVAERFSEEGLESPRYEAWLYGLGHILEEPGGGIQLDRNLFGTRWFHNLWLDVARTSGLLAMILLVAFQVVHVKDFVALAARSKAHPGAFALIVLLIGTLAVVSTSVPLEGDLCIFGLFVLLHGVIAGLRGSMARTGPVLGR